MGVAVTLVNERELKRSVNAGKDVTRVVFERQADGAWRLVIFLAGHNEAITLQRFRGGLRTWKTMENLLKYVQLLLPRYPAENIDVFLRSYSDIPGGKA